MKTVEMQKTWHFEAARRLPRLPPEHRCSRLHGSSFTVAVTVKSLMDPVLEWGVDFDVMEERWRTLHALLDHRLLNEVEGLENPTTENIAFWILAHFTLPPGALDARVTEVSVSELPTAKVTVRAT